MRLSGKSPGVYLEKKSNLFPFDCKPKRIDHEGHQDSNFEDDGQLEITIWSIKPEVLNLQK